ncbi:MAG: LuxR C-terminal-related transcriptional regulator [Dechloromonas sp.]|nr:LuxR C-terminal-related transcriptional regulator [Dechloromonas sp.]
MSLTHTGHAEIDQQHAILDQMVVRLQSFCERPAKAAPADCRQCAPLQQQQCTARLNGIVDELSAFLIGHATYEERMMELLPDTAPCQAHIKAHKAAHAGISRQLKVLNSQIGHELPQVTGQTLWQLIGNWLGDHATVFDHKLVRLGKSRAAEIDFDAELVAMLDQHVFPNRPTIRPVDQNQQARVHSRRVEMRGRFESLTPAQRSIFWPMIAGQKNQQIAEAQGISINTVKTHRAAIFQKFDVNSVLELIKKTDALR